MRYLITAGFKPSARWIKSELIRGGQAAKENKIGKTQDINKEVSEKTQKVSYWLHIFVLASCFNHSI